MSEIDKLIENIKEININLERLVIAVNKLNTTHTLMAEDNYLANRGDL